MSRSIRTLIVASTERLREAYRDFLAGAPGFETLELASPDEARGAAARYQPDLLIFALETPQLDALSLLREIEAASPRTHVFFSSLSRREVEALTPRGNGDGRSTPAVASNLLAALRPAPAAFQTVTHATDDPAAAGLPQAGAGPPQNGAEAPGLEALSSLTPREREVLRMAAEGLSSTETGHQLGISARTAECHRAHGMRKLGLHRRADLVRFAMTAGLVGGRTDLR